jgi:hypothetical protein
MFWNGVLRRIFGPRRDEIIAGCGKMHNDEVHNMYCWPDMVRKFKPRGMRWAGNIARVE